MEGNVNSLLRRSATTGGVVLVAAVALTSLLGSSSAGAAAGANAPGLGALARPATPARTTACARKTDAKAWSFGIEADTQWTVADDGKNPNTCSIDIARQLDKQFVNKGVKFVVEVGDLCDDGSVAGEDTRAVFAQELFNAGIGFYPLSGNHDDGESGELTTIYPQTQNAIMNMTPAGAFAVPNPDAATQPFPVQSGRPFKVGTISASPAAPDGLAGLDYAVDYRNARLVFLDQFSTPSDPAHEALDSNDVAWMNGQLAGRPAGTQAFVFGHKGIITENHTDTLFGNDPSADPSLQDTFISDLQNNGVHYYIGGHDHMYNRALVASPDFKSSVQDIISQSDASKFYIPLGAPGNGTAPLPDYKQSNDYTYDVPAFGAPRETEIAQQAAVGPATTGTVHVGYFIVTVDGPKVTVDYYSAPVTATLNGSVYLIGTTPKMTFVKQETFGYSLNGKEFFVPQGKPYTTVADQFQGTKARILGGTNDSTATDAAGRELTKDVTTGWTCRPRHHGLASNVLTLWGLADVGASSTDTYALSMSTSRCNGRDAQLGTLVAKNDEGRWVNAVDLNAGGAATFVLGPWKAGDKLGTYGIDPASHTAWAVVNHSGDFAMARGFEPAKGGRH